MRRERTEKLLVWERNLRWRIARYHTLQGERLPSQRRFLASPDGEWLVYADDRTLKARDSGGNTRVIEGTPGKDFRFAHDGSLIVVANQQLLRIRLESGRTERLAELPGGISWIECFRSGVAVHWYRTLEAHISLVSWSGEQRQVFAGARGGPWIDRLMASRDADRIAWIVDDVLFDCDARTARPLAKKRAYVYDVNNGEMSPDGERIAVVSERGLYTVDGEGRRQLLDEADIHSVWFSPSGKQLLAASTHRAVLLDGSRRTELVSDAPIRTARFAKDGPGVLLARGEQVIAWGADGQTEVLAEVPSPELPLGAASYRGGLAVWTASAYRRRRW